MKTIFKTTLLLWIAAATGVLAQTDRLSVAVLGGLQFQAEQFKASEGSGYGGDVQFNYIIGRGFRVNLSVASDFMNLTQATVLDEWEWDYWERTYIDFLPGAQVEEVNRTLVYNSADGIYSAVFNPDQNLKELRLAGGFDYPVSLSNRLQLIPGLQFGASLFKRELRMEEAWTKRFNLDTTSADLDYEYTYDLLHFAPPREGAKLFTAPILALSFNLSRSLDLTFAGQFLHYFDRDGVEWLEKLLGISEDGQRWFPLKSKTRFGAGLTFKY